MSSKGHLAHACLFLIFLLATTALKGQTLDWAKSYKSSQNGHGNYVTVDDSGYIYTTGYFSGNTDFDPGPGVYNLSSFSNFSSDVFIQKSDSTGALVWVKKIGSSFLDYGSAVAVDDSGNVVATGVFKGLIDLDPGLGVAYKSPLGTQDFYVVKLDRNGNHIWSHSFGSQDKALSEDIAIDPNGNIYVSGHYKDTVDFDPGPGSSLLHSTGQSDVFLLKLTPSGNHIWSRRFGGTAYAKNTSIAIDPFGDIVMTGQFSVYIDLNPGPLSNIQVDTGPWGNYDIFIVKLNSSGNHIWGRSVGGVSDDSANDITTDFTGKIIITGEYFGNADFDPSANIATPPNTTSSTIFVAKYNNLGNFVWVAGLGTGNNNSAGYAVETDSYGNIYSTGKFFGTNQDFDPSASVDNLSSPYSFNMYIHKMNASGIYQWAVSIGGFSHIFSSSIAVDSKDNFIITGDFFGHLDFDPGLGVSMDTCHNGIHDYFLQKFTPCEPNEGVDLVAACDSFVWIDGNTYFYSNNTATHLLQNQNGCDSLVTLDLTIHGTEFTQLVTACDSFQWIDGNTYYHSTQSPSHIVPNAIGCDSTIHLNLTINSSKTGIDSVVACDSFQWIDGITYTTSTQTPTITISTVNGCDSILTLHLTLLNSNSGIDSIVACKSYTWIDGITYTQSNQNASYVLPNSMGCDSTVFLDLEITNVADVTTWMSGTAIVATDSTAVSYRWIDCTRNFQIIPNANLHYYVPTSAGSYAVEINDGNCIDTSNCVFINNIGLESLSSGNTLEIFPNPSLGQFEVHLPSPLQDVQVSIFNYQGKLVYSEQRNSFFEDQIHFNGPSGIYILKIENADFNFSERIVIQ